MLIVRLGAMGDILHALPAVTALRAAHPGWFLGWAVEPQWQALLAADGESGLSTRSVRMPLVDRIHIVPAKQWGRHPLAPATLRQLIAIRRELRSAKYDVCVDLQGAARSAIIARWARSSRLIGEAAPREPIARWWFTEKVSTRGVHVIEQAAEVAGAISKESALRLGLPTLPFDAAADAWCALHAPPGPFVLLSPGAGWGAKRWPLESFAEVARGLGSEGLAVVVNASPAERRLGEELARQSGATALVPTLSQLIALSRRATIAIAGDTGPLHLSAALGRPVVGIYGPTDPLRNGPFHGQNIVLRHPGSKRDHTRRVEPEAGLLTITPEKVLGAARSLLLSNDRPLSAGAPATSAPTAGGREQ